MKKIKLLFSVIAISVFMHSCSKEESTEVEGGQTSEHILKFSTPSDMQKKIDEIDNFKKNQEEAILQKILTRKNMTMPTLDANSSFNNAKLSEIDEQELLEDVTYYHQEKLKAINAERTYFGFTSIQSIADEINFLQLINPEKGNLLFKKHSDLLNRNKFQTVPRTGNGISNVINTQGNVYVKGEYKNYKEPVNADQRSTGLPQTEEDILAEYYFPGPPVNDPIFTTTWHAGFNADTSNNYTLFTLIACFVNINSQQVPYAMIYTVGNNSKADFDPFNPCNPIFGSLSVPFVSGFDTNSSVNYSYSPSSTGCTFSFGPNTITGQVSGNFWAILGTNWVNFIGSDQF